jgi:Abnormal spindle-like microcephaly-assoc'd, ASPM-SPD-2-Hydin
VSKKLVKLLISLILGGPFLCFANSIAIPSAGGTSLIDQSGTGGNPTLSAFYCDSGGITGPATETCTLKLDSASPSGGMSVSVATNNPAVTLPATVTIPANATRTAFTANVASVSTAQTVTLAASVPGSGSITYAILLYPYISTLQVSTTNLVFEAVQLNAAATQSFTLSSTGAKPVTINSATLTGAGFTVSGATFPVTLTRGQNITLAVQFEPAVAGAAMGQLTVTSNSSTATPVINLSGLGGYPAPSALYCSSGGVTGAATETCNLKLNSASASGPVSVSLASNNPAITLPATVVIPTNAARTQFTANVASVSTAQTVILTASMPGSASITYPIQLHPYVSVSGSFAYAGSPLVSTLAPANPSTPISNKFFGMTIYYLAPNSLYPAPNMTTFPSFPVSTLRFWDSVYWSMIDSYEGQSNYTKMDNSIAIAQKNGVSDFIFTFGNVPAWASTNPTDPCVGGSGAGTCAPPNMDAFDSFATQLVQRYCGTVKYYEPWNEPSNPHFWDGTNAQLLTIAQHTYQIAKDPANCGCTNGVCSPKGGVNPNQVLLPPIAILTPADYAWLDSYLASAGTSYPYADIAAFHGYVWSGYAPEEVVSGMQLFEQIISKYGLANLPRWNTEVSWQSNASYDDQSQVSWLMRYHATQVALGIQRVVWYAYENCTWGTLWSSPLCSSTEGPADPVSQLTVAGAGYSTIEKWFSGASLTQCQQFQNGLWACELQRSGGNYSAWMLWSSTGARISVPVPGNFGLTVYRDWQNNVLTLPAQITVTQMPVLLENYDL